MLLAGSVFAPAGHADDPPTPVEISDGVLKWGVKASWRQYAGAGTVSDGAVRSSEGLYEFPIESGSYDPATGATTIKAKGSVHWQSHYYPNESHLYPPPASYTGPLDIHVLDVTLSNPELTLSADGSLLSMKALSRGVATWQIVDLGRVPLVNLDPLAVAPTVEDDVTTWSGIPATLTQQGATGGTFGGGYYAAGIAIDPVSFSYTGPGGPVDLTERWTDPDSTGLSLAVNGIWGDASGDNLYPMYVDDAGILHDRINAGGWKLRSFDLAAGELVGEPAPFGSPATFCLNQNFAFADTARATAYCAYTTQQAATLPIDYTFGWDPAAKTYSEGPLSPTFTPNLRNLLWDRWRSRAIKLERVVPDGVSATDYDAHEWYVVTYTPQEDRSVTERRYRLPNGPACRNQNWYNAAATGPTTSATGASVSADGTITVLRAGSLPTQAGCTPEPLDAIGVQRIVLDEDAATASVSEIPGTELPIGQLSQNYNRVLAGADGHVSLVRNGSPARILQFKTDANGDFAQVGAEVSIPWTKTGHVADSPVDGTVWLNSNGTKRLTGVRDGRIVFERTIAIINERTSRFPQIGTLPNGDVWFVSSDGEPAGILASPHGYARFTVDGYSPSIAEQPGSASVTLGVGEQSETVEFASTATANPEPSRQWQVKEPGTSRFVDIEGETDEALAVDAKPGMDGSQYRAVYENAAGELASEPATLNVDYAPRAAVDVANAVVTEGADAVLQVLPDGYPEPSVAWQRRVGGYWQNIAPDDDNFVIDGGTLTVTDTNTDQTGSLFRAKLVNSVATVYSRTAKLMVNPKVAIPDGGVELENVSLDWTGNAELQKAPPFGGSNYFSAGVSDGTEATYRAGSGSVRVFQVSPLGIESPATYLTRAGHVTGGGKQLVRLYGGDARIEPDGSATVEWDGSFSVNFYGGLVPFTLTDPELEVDEDGVGTLKADLSGYASSMDNPNEREPIAPVSDVTVATFSGVEIDPAGRIEIAPDWAGVEVAVPDGVMPQNRTASGWGAWPQAFVDFHVQTGLSSYWYTSGGAFDQYKPPAPFAVDFDGPMLPTDPPPDDPRPPVDPRPQPKPQPKPAAKPASIAPLKKAQTINGKRIAKLATLSCPKGGAACTVAAPKRVKVKIAGRRYTLAVLTPKKVKAGQRAVLRVRMPKPAAKRLKGRRATVKVKVAIAMQGKRTTRTVRVTIRAR